MKSNINYEFIPIEKCNMCGSKKEDFKVIGQRLNSTQGINPKKKSGITVSVIKCKKCNLIFSSPRPVPKSIEDHYNINPDDYWKEEYFKVDSNYFLKEIKIAKRLLRFEP